MSFVHLHVHTQYSILDGQASIEGLFKRAKELNMPALAITDHGNLYGLKEFMKVWKTKDKDSGEKPYKDIKPILGCEIYVTTHYDHCIKDSAHRSYYHLILLAKNYNGYKNLMKIVSTGHIEGMYYSKPRVRHEVVEKYAKDLICCSACIAGEVPKNLIAENWEGACKAVEWHKKVFGDDYYLEVQSHKTEVPGLSLEVWEKQQIVNAGIFKLAEKYGVKVIASNDVHFVRKEDGPAHDRLICLTTNCYLDDPDRMRYTQQEYLKSREEMAALFPDHPEVLDNTLEVAAKIEQYEIDRDPVLPKFALPKEFLSQIDVYLERYKGIIDAGRNDKNGVYRGDDFCHSVAYLCHLCYEGAKERYGDTLNEEQAERIEFELKVISQMGFPDYFLIVQDFIAAARAVGTSVGPGRGSAAGSAVAYCLHITNLDPIKYDLLFERFLNPDRINMPDIDIDFDDIGRYGAFQYISDTYGKDHISHVITFGTMAAKSAINDVGRVSRLPREICTKLTKLIPDRPFTKKINGEEKEFKPTLSNCLKYGELKAEYDNGSELVKEVLNYAEKLEGCIRQTGVHACAMIIGQGDLTDHIPITLAEDKETKQMVWTSQYDGHYIEEVGMLKMDFLGLKTLSIIKDCLEMVKKNHGIDIDIEKIPIDDPDTYKLYARGDTKSVFQFESPGMREWLIKLRPDCFEDLIAMNALYRPGPMDYIPSFVKRKLGQEEISYDLPVMEDTLKNTYGVTVYQEQVMLLSRKIAGFTRGQADTLRKAMGKKIKKMLDELYPKFIEGGTANGHPKEVLDKIWEDWQAFAKYAFNKSHATCYAWVSYQTGWLKAHYLPEFQAANLTKNISNIEEIKAIMSDCKKGGIDVLLPDINESAAHFTVNHEGNIHFGLEAIKGFGSNVAQAIVEEREKNGVFEDIFDFVERMGSLVSRRNLESLLYAGAFDTFGQPRGCYLAAGKSGELFLDELVKYADLYQRDKENASSSLFGDIEEMKPQRPELPQVAVDEENQMELLYREKELIGMYLSNHPLDRFSFEINNYTNCQLADLQEQIAECNEKRQGKKVRLAGLVTNFESGTSQNNNPYCKFELEDFSGSYTFRLFGKTIESFLQYVSRIGESIFIEAEIKEPYYGKSDAGKKNDTLPSYKLKINNMYLLGNTNELMLEGFRIIISTEYLNQDFRKNLMTLLKKFKGKIPLYINIEDPSTKYKIDMYSRKFQISPCAELINALEALHARCELMRKA